MQNVNLAEEHPEDRQHTHGDCDRCNRSPKNVAFPSKKARGGRRENDALRGEHAGMAPRDVLHRSGEPRRDVEPTGRLDL